MKWVVAPAATRWQLFGRWLYYKTFVGPRLWWYEHGRLFDGWLSAFAFWRASNESSPIFMTSARWAGVTGGSIRSG